MGNSINSVFKLFSQPSHHVLDKQRELILYYGGWTKTFCYTFFVISILNSLARADCTFGIAILGLLSILHSHKGLAEIFFGLLTFSLIIDIAWTATHGNYLHDFGRIPRMAADSMASLMRMHKFSLAISIIQILAKSSSLFFVYNFWNVLPQKLPQHINSNAAYNDILKNEKSKHED
jgi:hypothetical protein